MRWRRGALRAALPAIGAAACLAFSLGGCWPAHGDIHVQGADPRGPYTLNYTPSNCSASFNTDDRGRSTWHVMIGGDKVDRETTSNLDALFPTDDAGLQVETPEEVDLEFGYGHLLKLTPKACTKYVAEERMDVHHDLHVRFEFDCRSNGRRAWGNVWSGDCQVD